MRLPLRSSRICSLWSRRRERGWWWGESQRGRNCCGETHEKPRYLGGVRGAQRNAAGLLATVVSYKAFAEFFVFAVTLAALIANAFTTFRVLALAGFAVVSFDALAIFFPIAVTLVTLMANVLAAFGVLAFAAEIPGFAALSPRIPGILRGRRGARGTHGERARSAPRAHLPGLS